MFAHIRAFDAAGEPAVARPFRLASAVPAILLGGLVVLLAGCADAPRAPVVGPDPADPTARAPRIDYRSTVGSYRSQRPVEPAPWGERNEGAAPAPKSGR